MIEIENKNKIYNLTSVLAGSEEIKNGWNFFFSEPIFYIKDNILYEFDYIKMSSKKILENINSFLVQNNRIYFFNSNDNALYSSNINNLSNIKKIAVMPEDFDSELLAKITRTGKNTYVFFWQFIFYR